MISPVQVRFCNLDSKRGNHEVRQVEHNVPICIGQPGKDRRRLSCERDCARDGYSHGQLR
jgi:hypothetical protein